MYLDKKKEFRKLVQLVESRNYEGVERLIMSDDRLQTVDFLNMVGENKFTVLHYAAKVGHVEIVIFLIRLQDHRGVSHMSKSMDAADVYGCTPLHIAAKYGYVDIAECLLDCTLWINGRRSDMPAVDINVTDNTNMTPLHYAALKGRLNFIKLLVQKGADIFATSEGDTALHKAARFNQEDVVAFFLDLGLSIDDPGYNLNTPLHFAAKNGFHYLFRFLIKKGADMNAENIDGKTAIYIVVEQGYLDDLLFVINQNKFDINDPIPKENFTALQYAAKKGELENVKWHVKHGANIHANEHTECKTALHFAAEEGHIEVVKFLVDMGANIFDKLDCGSKALHLASSEGYKNVVEFFLDQGLSVNDLGSGGETPLHKAAKRGHLHLAKFFLDRGADTKIRNVDGCWPIDCARHKNHTSVQKLLYDHVQALNPQSECVIL